MIAQELQVRRLTAEGIEAFRGLLDSAASGNYERPGFTALTTSSGLTRIVAEDLQITPTQHGTRRSLGHALHQALLPLEKSGIDRDVGLWSWLALAHFPVLAAESHDGRGRVVSSHARWVFEATDHRLNYRHYLWTPWATTRAHAARPEAADVLLCKPPTSPGDIVEQLSARIDWMTNPVVVGAATRLYYDRSKNAQKRGAANKGDGSTPGCNLRFVHFLQTLELTWHLRAMSVDQLLGMLPDEFDSWLPSDGS